MSRGPFQFKSGKKPESTRMSAVRRSQLELALRMWEIREEYPAIVPWREQISAEHRAHQARQRRQS